MAGEKFRRLPQPEVVRGGYFFEEVRYSWQPSFLPSLEAAVPKDLQGRTSVLQKYDRVMFALGNTDLKPAILLHGLSPTPKNAQHILDDAASVLPAGTWLPKEAGLKSYLREGYCPPGIAVEHDYSGRYYYATSPDGEGIAKDVAGLFLTIADKEKMPVSIVFGNTAASEDLGVRSYINRTSILLLLSAAPSYVSEISRKTDVAMSVIGGNLARLRDLGLVEYKFADTEVQGWGVYERAGTPDQVTHSVTYSRLRGNVLEYYRLNETGNPQTIAKALGRSDKSDVFKILSELVEDGFLKRTQWYGGLQQSDAQITEQGTAFVNDLILPILYAYAGDSSALRHLSSIRHDALDPALAARVITQQKSVAQRKPRSQTREEILQLVTSNGPMRAKQILDTLGGRAEALFSGLLASGELVSRQVGRGSYYMLPGMEFTAPQGEVIVYDFQQPENLAPPTCRPREEYRAELETTAFWSTLAEDLSQVPEETVTERDFFSFYSPDNPHWQERDNYITGKYSNHMIALRKLGVRYPYRFLKEFKPAQQQPELVAAIAQAKQVMQERLIPSKEMKTFRDYYEEMHTEEFWRQLQIEIDRAPAGITVFQFLAYTSDDPAQSYDTAIPGKYYNLYQVVGIGRGKGIYFLPRFEPTLPHTPELRDLVAQAKQAMADKFVLKREPISTEKWERLLDSDEFWEELQADVERYTGDTTFLNFLYNYDEDNLSAQTRRRPDGKRFLGKHYRIVANFELELLMLAELPPIDQWPEELLASTKGILTSFIYNRSPKGLRDILALKFPKDFEPAHMAQLQLLARQMLGHPSDVSLNERAYIAHALAVAKEKSAIAAPDSRQKDLELGKAMEYGGIASARLDMNTDFPDRDQLEGFVQEGKDARESLIASGQRVVAAVARHYGSMGIPFQDLVQRGNIGLLQAVIRYDWRFGVRFGAYARNFVRGEILRGFAEEGILVPHDVNTHRRLQAFQKNVRGLEQELGRTPTMSEVINKLNKPEEEVEFYFRLAQAPTSLDAPRPGDEERTLLDFMPDTTIEQPETAAVRSAAQQVIELCLQTAAISKRQAEIIRLRFGLIDGELYELPVLAEKFGIDEERVAELIEEALEELRRSPHIEQLREFL